MSKASSKSSESSPTRVKLVEAAIRLILQQGFAATGVEQICSAAGVTKGAFFHYFKSKEEIGHAAMEAWASFGMSIYSVVRNDSSTDPLDQLHHLFDIMIGLAERDELLACVIGMTAQEMAAVSPALRASCDRHFVAWVEFVADILSDAKSKHPPVVDFDPKEVAWMLHSLWQGSMLLAKTHQDQQMIVRNLLHAKAYVDRLFFESATSASPGGSDFRNPTSSPRTGGVT